jgi:hypothetical protein
MVTEGQAPFLGRDKSARTLPMGMGDGEGE